MEFYRKKNPCNLFKPLKQTSQSIQFAPIRERHGINAYPFKLGYHLPVSSAVELIVFLLELFACVTHSVVLRDKLRKSAHSAA